MTVIVFEVIGINTEGCELIFHDTFKNKKSAEQWILNWAKNNRKFVIMDLYSAGELNK